MNSEGEVDYLIGYGLDITDLRAATDSLERSRRLFQTVLETIADGIILLDSHSRIMLINEEVRRIWGYSKEALIHEDFQLLFKEGMFDLATWTGDVDSMYKEIMGQSVELTGVRRDGSTFPVEINVSRMEFNEEVYYTVALSDITERRKRLKELEVARNIAIESTKAKEQFLAHISHEIRTPMNAVLGFTHLLLELNPSEEQVQFLKAIKYSTDNLLVIINDILDFSKIEANKLEFIIDDFSLLESVNHVIESVRYSADEKGIKVGATIADNVPFWVRGDQVRFGQILLNLVSNSVKFTEQGGVSVSVDVLSEDIEEIRLEIKVTDTGIGIPKQYLNKIFDSFEQVKSRDRRAKMGTGLGLAIVRSLVEKQGGQIFVTSTEGAGSEFVVQMPFRVSNRDDLILGSDILEEATHSHKDLTGLRVLVVEDNEMNQLVATCTYMVAANGKLAIVLYKNEDFDIILMDLSMPVMNGFETSEAIRLDFPFPKKDIPILAFTASAMIESKDRVYTSGMNDYISKPVKPVELQKKIFNLVGRDVITTEKNVLTEKTNEVSVHEDAKFKYIRLDYLNELTGSDEDIINEMMNLFAEKTPEVLENLRSLYNSKDWEEFKKVAHKFKPSLSYMGIKELDGVIPQIEKLAQVNDPEGKIPVLLDSLDFYSNEAMKEIKKSQSGK
ncbi:MAG: response regulator [Ignavibacteriales bacterium]|nr:response regulator [Ignavibacteriales bacterium]